MLGLPYHESIGKVRETQPQKSMQNSAQQAANLAGYFTARLPMNVEGPVLLVDDVVDSRWTFTILAALLRNAGSGPVFPIALADTSGGDS